MKVCILYYDGFSEFEIVLNALQFKNNLETVSLEDRIYKSAGNQKFVPDNIIDNVNPKEVDLFIIPGGDPSYLFQNEKLKNFILELNKNNKLIAGICGGTQLMASYGILKNKKCTGNSYGIFKEDEYFELFEGAILDNGDVVIDGNIITSTAQSFIEFAMTLGIVMGIRKKDDGFYQFFKSVK